MPLTSPSADLFRHVSAEKTEAYRVVLEVFATAKQQFRPYLRPDEVRDEASWPHGTPPVEEVQQLLRQLTEWGNLEAQPDTSRVETLEDFYRARFLYRLSVGGEAVEVGLAAFVTALEQRGELQSVALSDIFDRLTTLAALAQADSLDVAKIHEVLRDVTRVFLDLAENAQAFMVGIARGVDVERGEVDAIMRYKARLIEYLENFIGELVSKSYRVALLLEQLDPHADRLLRAAARRETRDALIDEGEDEAEVATRFARWRERWKGLCGWFVADGREPSQAERLRARARGAIPALLGTIAALNERRAGRSDRAADYRALARWFAGTRSDAEAHRLYRAAFALNGARHLALTSADAPAGATTRWRDGPRVHVSARLRERGSITPRGPGPRSRDRGEDRALLGRMLAEQQVSIDRARARFATGQPFTLSELSTHKPLDRHELALLLGVIGEALGAQASPQDKIERSSNDGSLEILFEPLDADARATVHSELGTFAGRDHRLTLHPGDSS